MHGLVQQDQGDAALQRTHRAQQLAEVGCALTQHVHQEHGQQDDKHQEDDLFQLAAPEGPALFREGDLVQQVLDQAEGTQPAADEPADQRTNKKQDSDHINFSLSRLIIWMPLPGRRRQQGDQLRGAIVEHIVH